MSGIENTERDILEEVPEDADSATGQQGQEDAATEAGVQSVGLLKNDGDGLEEQVHDAVAGNQRRRERVSAR